MYLDLGEGDEETPLQSDPYSDSPETHLMLAPDFFFFVPTNNDCDPLFAMILVLGNTRLRQQCFRLLPTLIWSYHPLQFPDCSDRIKIVIYGICGDLGVL